MQKLTKEQAQWLIEKINEKSNSVHTTDSSKWHMAQGISFERHRLEAIIKQCTEIEFPKFEMLLGVEKHSLRAEEVKGASEPFVLLAIDEVGLTINRNLFKEFTRNCNKIVEWLDEQEFD